MYFKEIIREKLLIAAKSYSYFLDKTINICSFNKKVNFYRSNFLHLTGVRTSLKAVEFYEKCANKTITISDFHFNNNNLIKTYSVRKLSYLVEINNFFESRIILQLHFKKGKIRSAFALSNGLCTIGFIKIKGTYVPQTLLDRNYLDKNMPIFHVNVSITKHHK